MEGAYHFRKNQEAQGINHIKTADSFLSTVASHLNVITVSHVIQKKFCEVYTFSSEDPPGCLPSPQAASVLPHR